MGASSTKEFAQKTETSVSSEDTTEEKREKNKKYEEHSEEKLERRDYTPQTQNTKTTAEPATVVQKISSRVLGLSPAFQFVFQLFLESLFSPMPQALVLVSKTLLSQFVLGKFTLLSYFFKPQNPEMPIPNLASQSPSSLLDDKSKKKLLSTNASRKSDRKETNNQDQKLKQKFKEEFASLIIPHTEIDVSFQNFPYYLSERDKELLIDYTFPHFKPEFAKWVYSLPSINLSSVPGTELYHESIAKALAKHFKASILILEPANLEVDKSKDADSKRESVAPEWSRLHKKMLRMSHGSKLVDSPGKVMIAFENPTMGVKRPESPNLFEDLFDEHSFFSGDLKLGEERHDMLIVETLFETLAEQKNPCILFIKDTPNTILQSRDRWAAFSNEIARITGPIFVICSVMIEAKQAVSQSQSSNSSFSVFHVPSREERLSKVLSKICGTRVVLSPPLDSEKLMEWNKQMERDVQQAKALKNQKIISKILQKRDLECEKFEAAELKNQELSVEKAEALVNLAVSVELRKTGKPDTNNGKLKISSASMLYSLQQIFDEDQQKRSLNNLNVDQLNEFERQLLSETILPSDLNVTFEDIGALEEVKQILKEEIMLPLQRPELFQRGVLVKPCQGILLFGPPGTGKTMLAKAVASQSGANFINVSVSTVSSKWFGEGEKFVKALFTLASKIAPTVIFIDEVDSFLGKRNQNEHEAMRKIKNEFMTHWDGLTTKRNERVLVLAATNRPFDLDEAVLRRLTRRVLVDLPTFEQRIKILKVILAKETLDSSVDFESLGRLTEGFSGSDMLILCREAAFQPVREASLTDSTQPTYIRPISFKDFEEGFKKIKKSVSEDAYSVAEMRKWDEEFGGGSSQHKKQIAFSYYL